MKQTKFENPLDNLFEIDDSLDRDESDYEIATVQNAPAEPVEKDEEDIDTDQKIDAVYDAALEAYQNQTAMVELLEPRYAARNAEVAATYLNIALQAATSKARVKNDRKRVGQFIPGASNKITNNTIVASREEILRMITVDSEPKKLS